MAKIIQLHNREVLADLPSVLSIPKRRPGVFKSKVSSLDLYVIAYTETDAVAIWNDAKLRDLGLKDPTPEPPPEPKGPAFISQA